MRKLTVDEAFDALRYDTEGRFFSVTTERRTTRRDRTQRAGDLRTFLCRAAGSMTAYKLGVISDEQRDAEDLRTGTLTVWSLDAYMSHVRHGRDKEWAKWNSWRRVDLMGLRHPQAQCSVIDDAELPIRYRPEYHDVTNAFRAANMPRVSQAR